MSETPIDCWVGDKLFFNAGNADTEGIELIELLRLGIGAKLGNQAQRVSVALAEFAQERTNEQMRATRNEAIVEVVMQDRVLFEMARKQPISADCVLRYLDDTLAQNPDATRHLGLAEILAENKSG